MGSLNHAAVFQAWTFYIFASFASVGNNKATFASGI